MSALLTLKRFLVAVLLVALCFMTVPLSAYASDNKNTISTSKSSIKVGKSITLTCKTTYSMWGVGPVGIPFMSDWLTEVPYKNYAKPVVKSHTGKTNGAWKKASGIRVSGTVWQQKTSPSWFYGKTTWSGKYTVKAIKTSGKLKFAHGQTKNSKTSKGATAFTYVKAIK